MTDCQALIENHLQYLKGHMNCRTSGDRVWVSSPHTHLDGDAVEFAIREQPDGTFAVSDLGETLRQLAAFGYDPRATPNGRYLLNQIAKQYRVELTPDGVIFRVCPGERLGETANDVILAALAAGNLLFLARASRPATIQEEVSTFLRAANVPFRERVKVRGETSKAYVVDFVLGSNQALVKTISATTPGGITSATNATFRAWHDISQGWKATILDDRTWEWRHEDIALLASVGKVYQWSEQQGVFLDELNHLAVTTPSA